MAAASALNLAKLYSSLVAPPKGTARSKQGAAPAGADRGRETLDHLHSIVYPASLVEADTRAMPFSVGAGMRTRAAAAAKARNLRSCPREATPARMSACAQATLAADLALAKYHESESSVFGDEDGRLQEVVSLSLAMDNVCSVEELYDRSE